MIKADFVKALPELRIEARFTVPERGTTVLWGDSGSGKTTILNCLAGLSRPDSGVIGILGRTVFSSADGLDLPTRERGVGLVFQHYALFPHLSVLENVALALPFGAGRQDGGGPSGPRPGAGLLRGAGLAQARAKERALAWLGRFGIAHLARRRPGSLSGGERQRLAFARALAAEPRVLLLDEPFSALDRRTKAAMHEEFLALRRELTMSVILVSHDRAEAESLGDRILGVEDGRAVEEVMDGAAAGQDNRSGN